MKDQDALLEQFVGSFEKLDDLSTSKEIDPIAWDLGVEEADEYGHRNWRPVKTSTDRSSLETLYAVLPGRFPPLFETLVLSFRWAEVDLQSFRLLANPPGTDLAGLFEQISGDPGLYESLIPAGYVQFGRGPDLDYDPVCFDIKRRTNNRDYPVVKIDHEEILCNYLIKVVGEIAPTFEELVRDTIRRGSSSKERR
jgi:hypothetical protein